MKTKILNLFCVCLTVILMTAASLGQQSGQATEQEVLAHIENCWNAWMDAVKSGDPDDFFAKCHYAENSGLWAATDGIPQSELRVRRNWKDIE
jgi:hypothetical protein